jgi:hypothetical protein
MSRLDLYLLALELLFKGMALVLIGVVCVVAK